jgi:cytochrome c nitrite reductase small subunit
VRDPTPPRRPSTFYLNIGVAAVLGILFGLGIFTFSYAEGLSYFSDDPNSCMNCHVMRDQFEAWNHSSHKTIAACNDCHTPHHNVVAKYTVKAINGFNHSVRFTFDAFPEPIRIRPMNKMVAEENCVGCHTNMVSQIHLSAVGAATDCIRCHENVGHRNLD